MKRIIYTDKAPAPIGPYSQAVESGGFLFVSGQIPIDSASGNLVEGSIQEETHQVMKNLQAILEEADMNFENVLKCSIFVADMQDFGAVNEVYGSYFTNNPPARETVEVSTLPKNVNIEISCIASK
jgi:2-iminobutanoate/2-iminopropanoate deaminase